MAGRYSKQFWQSGTVLAPYGPLSGPRLQKLDDAMAQIYDDHDAHVGATGDPHPMYLLEPLSPLTNGVVYWNGSAWIAAKLTAAQIDAAAAIAKSQLAALHIVDADVDSISAAKITGLAAAIPSGSLLEYGGDTLPGGGWVWADGSLYDGTNPTYAALWGAYGTRHGGTGISSFAVPDCRGRVTVMKGTHSDVDTVGKNDGVAVASRRPRHAHNHTLTLPNHGHSVSDPTHTHGVQVPSGGGSSGPAGGAQGTVAGATGAAATGISVGNPTSNPAINGAVGAAGMLESEAYYVVNKIVKL